ncbi:MAG: DUF4129 domain-containing protein [Rhodothermaceae bacterium]|nr:DUF4129 domain-containing protein [Rhodothermaceae bacterium]
MSVTPVAGAGANASVVTSANVSISVSASVVAGVNANAGTSANASVGAGVNANSGTSSSSSAIVDVNRELRKPSQQTIQELQSELVYERAPDQSPTLLQRLRAWFFEQIFRFFSNRVAADIYTYAWYIFFGILLLFAIILIFRSEINAVFKIRDPKVETGPVNWDVDDIRDRDFLNMAGEMAEKGDYRSALRYRYLHLIQLLAAGKLIVWRPDKTNHDYLRELAGTQVREAFRYMTYLFNYTWYGHFDLDEVTYARAVDSLKSVEKQIGSGGG